jgi:hypothetical protein
LHLTCGNLVLVYNPNFFIFHTHFLKKLLHLDLLSYILYIHVFYHQKMINFYSIYTSLTFIFFRTKKHVWTKSTKMCCKYEFHQFQFMLLFFWYSILRFISILRGNGAHLIFKRTLKEKKKGFSINIFFNVWKHAKGLLKSHKFWSKFSSCWNFAINKTYYNSFLQSIFLWSPYDFSKIEDYSFKHYPNILCLLLLYLYFISTLHCLAYENFDFA